VRGNVEGIVGIVNDIIAHQAAKTVRDQNLVYRYAEDSCDVMAAPRATIPTTVRVVIYCSAVTMCNYSQSSVCECVSKEVMLTMHATITRKLSFAKQVSCDCHKQAWDMIKPLSFSAVILTQDLCIQSA
jgi:hypothetical protein